MNLRNEGVQGEMRGQIPGVIIAKGSPDESATEGGNPKHQRFT